MNKQDFALQLVETLKNEYQLDTTIVTALKHHDVEFTGICSKVTNSEECSPVVYIEELYEAYLKSMCTLSNAAAQIHAILIEDNIPFPTVFTSFEKAREILRYYVASADSQLYVDECAAVIHHLGLYFYPVLSFSTTMSAKVTKKLVKYWGVTEEEIMRVAMENTSAGLKTVPLLDVLGDFVDAQEADSSIHIISNVNSVHGASALLFPSYITNLAKGLKMSKPYVLPSSIHELLLLDGAQLSEDALCEMVYSVNSNIVSLQELLSNNIFRVDLDTSTLTVVESAYA